MRVILNPSSPWGGGRRRGFLRRLLRRFELAGVAAFHRFFAAPIEEQLWAMMVPGLIASQATRNGEDYCWN